MAVELTGVTIRHERRVRLVFSNILDAGAFGSPAPSYYTITCEDASGVDPSISAAIVVSGAGTNVELALGDDLVAGGLYRLSAIGVPATDLSVSTSVSTQLFRTGTPAEDFDSEPKAKDGSLLLYRRDLMWT